jgi:hypothetical protein
MASGEAAIPANARRRDNRDIRQLPSILNPACFAVPGIVVEPRRHATSREFSMPLIPGKTRTATGEATRVTRGSCLVAFAALSSLLTSGLAQADGRCDLNTLVGYQLVFAKPIDGYIQAGQMKKGYEGCELDRVLVFADNTGVRCKDVALQHLDELPTGYLFARNNYGDMKLCVEGQLFDVSKTN